MLEPPPLGPAAEAEVSPLPVASEDNVDESLPPAGAEDEVDWSLLVAGLVEDVDDGSLVEADGSLPEADESLAEADESPVLELDGAVSVDPVLVELPESLFADESVPDESVADESVAEEPAGEDGEPAVEDVVSAAGVLAVAVEETEPPEPPEVCETESLGDEAGELSLAAVLLSPEVVPPGVPLSLDPVLAVELGALDEAALWSLVPPASGSAAVLCSGTAALCCAGAPEPDWS